MKDEKLINRYLDGEANSKEIRYVETKLAQDKDFARVFAKYQEVDSLLSKVSNEYVAEDIYKRVLNSVKYQTKPQPFYKKYGPALVGSMMSFVLGILFTTFVVTTPEENLNSVSDNSLYSSLEIDEVINYYYGD